MKAELRPTGATLRITHAPKRRHGGVCNCAQQRLSADRPTVVADCRPQRRVNDEFENRDRWIALILRERSLNASHANATKFFIKVAEIGNCTSTYLTEAYRKIVGYTKAVQPPIARRRFRLDDQDAADKALYL